LALASFFYLFYDGNNGHATSYWGGYFPMAMVIGGICAATAPAAVMAIVHEYRAKGPFTTVLLGVLAMDDAMAILFFGFTGAAAQILVNQQSVTWQSFLLAPTISIFIALFAGAAVGMGLRWLIRFVKRKDAILGIVIGAIFLTSGLSSGLHAPALLANMMLGFVTINFVRHHEDVFWVVESIEEPVFGMFFTLAGAHLDLRVVETAGVLALLITLGRFAGKFLGSRVGARISHAPQTVRKYLGFALLPTAGVTVGLALEARNIFGASAMSELMVNAVLGSVIVNELLTPFFVRYSLLKAGEATLEATEDK
jgi:Kef-type K+ transport system membrane component KefB